LDLSCRKERLREIPQRSSKFCHHFLRACNSHFFYSLPGKAAIRLHRAVAQCWDRLIFILISSDLAKPPFFHRKGRYRISLAQKRVFDTAETVRFCCLDHVVRSGGFRATLEDERPLLPSGEELRAAVDAVTGQLERGLQSASESE
jgi:hypothetical protein